MNFEELQSKWSSLKADTASQGIHSPDKKNSVMEKIVQMEEKARQSRRRTELSTLPIIPMALLFIYLFTSDSWLASAGLLLVSFAIVFLVYFMRSTAIQLAAHDQRSIAFLKHSREQLHKRIETGKVMIIGYMFAITAGMFMYFSYILRDVSPTVWWTAHLGLLVYAVLIYFVSLKKNKQWEAEEVQPILTHIDKVLAD